MTSALVEPKLVIREDMFQPEVVPLIPGEAVIFSSRSPARTTDNEDAAALIPTVDGRLVLAVADGVGGHALGAEAAGLAVTAVAESVRGTEPGVELRSAVLNGIETADAQICDLAVGAATTLSVVELDGRGVRSYHVGDSTTMIVGRRGKIRLETVPHSPVGYAVEAGLLDATEAMHHEDRHLVSNIVGSTEMRIEVGAVLDLQPRDTVLISSDGLSDNLHVEEIVALARKGDLLEQAIEIAELAQRRMTEPEDGHPSKADDLTLILFRAHAAPRSTPPS